MDGAETTKTVKVPNVDCQQLIYSMDVHCGCEPGVVDLGTLHFVFHE